MHLAAASPSTRASKTGPRRISLALVTVYVYQVSTFDPTGDALIYHNRIGVYISCAMIYFCSSSVLIRLLIRLCFEVFWRHDSVIANSTSARGLPPVPPRYPVGLIVYRPFRFQSFLLALFRCFHFPEFTGLIFVHASYVFS